ncbi:putative glutaminase protein [Botrytis fragariae]|uniref:Putative glutaminase protein n=1 Tax=Botrytis fragariae TaxID=1964551 RepID=A0A8H6AJM2_9HELO|nr:putative glutaminase protein [Botrytis fragariae]KAF5868871.1 putative glutaminase protein [Botrytis fragariae]
MVSINIILLEILSTAITQSYAQGTFTPERPPAVPLMVKSPYLNSWQIFGTNATDYENGNSLALRWSTFWQDSSNQITGMTGIVRVDGEPLTWMGYPYAADNKTLLKSAEQTSFEYTSTKSIFTFDVGGKINLTATFLSPLNPKDLKQQSLTMAYLHVDVVSTDGKTHDVSVYADISAEWVSGDRSSKAQWDYGVTDDKVAYHRVYRQEQLAFTEINEQAEWGYWYWATQDNSNITYQSGADKAVRAAFQNEGKLPNTKDWNYRAINDEFPTFGFAKNFGNLYTTAQDVVFVLGLAQKDAIQFDGSGGNTTLPSLWTSYFASDTDALSFFYNEWDTSRSFSNTFDDMISRDSIAFGGQDYLTITSLSARQAFGTTQLVGSSLNPYLFIKEISSDGNVQTVDVLFPMHPILLYTNPLLLKLALKPLFENQETGRYPNTYSMHDLGSAYPNATGHSAGNDEEMPLEECGNMLIMSLSYFRATNDTEFLNDHYSILDQWTQYLIASALIPANQLSTDDFAGKLVNQTNLALKGIIGIKAMAEIASLTSHSDVSSNYSSIAQNYVENWMHLAVVNYTGSSSSSPMLAHTSLNYANASSYSLLYNLFPDKLLSLNIIPQSIYDMQSTFYPSVTNTYGVPLDSRHEWTKSDWNIWCASIASDQTKKEMIGNVAKFVGMSESGVALTDFYDTKTADLADFGAHFIARPVVGGHFAGVALNKLGVEV